MTNNGDTNTSANGAHGVDPLDAFSVQRGPAIVGLNGAPVDAAPTSDEAPDAAAQRAAQRAEAFVAELRANAWSEQGKALAARVQSRADGDEAPIATPWESVNDAMGGGLWPGMYVLVGATGSGKSQWAMQTVMHAAREHRVPALLLSLELDALGVFARGASFVTATAVDDNGNALPHVMWSTFYTGGHHRDAARRDTFRANITAALPHAVAAMESLPVHWYEAPPHGMPHTDLRDRCAALRALYPEHAGPVLVVLDFLQLVAGEDAREDSVTRVSRASYQCRAIARELNAVVLVLSSTSREGGKGIGETGRAIKNARDDDGTLQREALPYAGDLVGLGKESGDVEYSADGVLVLVREARDPDAGPAKGGTPVHMAVAKLRAGAPSWCELRFNGTRFRAPPPPPPAGPPLHNVWCETCDDHVRAVQHPERADALMCTRGGCVLEPQPVEGSDGRSDAGAAAKPVQFGSRGKAKGKAKGKGDAPSPSTDSTPNDDANGDTDR